MMDRVSANPGRMLITPEDGSAPFYATLSMADNPTVEGTPLNKASLLTDETAALFGLGTDAVPNDVFRAILNPSVRPGYELVATVEPPTTSFIFEFSPEDYSTTFSVVCVRYDDYQYASLTVEAVGKNPDTQESAQIINLEGYKIGASGSITSDVSKVYCNRAKILEVNVNVQNPYNAANKDVSFNVLISTQNAEVTSATRFYTQCAVSAISGHVFVYGIKITMGGFTSGNEGKAKLFIFRHKYEQ